MDIEPENYQIETDDSRAENFGGDVQIFILSFRLNSGMRQKKARLQPKSMLNVCNGLICSRAMPASPKSNMPQLNKR